MVKRELTLSDGTVVVAAGWAIFDKKTSKPRRGDRWEGGIYPEIYPRKQDAERWKYRGDKVKRVYVER